MVCNTPLFKLPAGLPVESMDIRFFEYNGRGLLSPFFIPTTPNSQIFAAAVRRGLRH